MAFTRRVSRDEKGVVENNRILELHLYPGNFCNRDCSFCTVFGSPKGWYAEYTQAHLDAALKSVVTQADGALKFYGGEPTLNHENAIWAIRYVRARGFEGTIAIFSNGILADRLIEVLESDPLAYITAALNYSIATGDGAPQMPQESLARLSAYEAEHPGKITIAHADIVDSGWGIEPFTGDRTRPKQETVCPHCYPVLTSKGEFHACPFAIESRAPHYQLGNLESDPAVVAANYQTFLHWLDTVHQPFAEDHNLAACTVCMQHLKELPVPEFA
ncbi:radical SAM protein [Synechococcus sp. PCC 7336]|uniref:radical SAM protein n=1 Tax=Synechococcus sp. PCC 7336 TaxID=195250 RepID=UPI0003620E61|nr:radical SAM protein [Synechococcus sp. PCC 7336]